MSEKLLACSSRPVTSTPPVVPVRDTSGSAMLLTLLSMSCIQFGAALSGQAIDAYGSLSVTAWRLVWAALVMTLVVRPAFSRFSRAHWLAAGGLGLAMAGMTLCFFGAIERIPLGLDVAIEFLGPLTVATFGARRGRALVWPFVAAAGVLMLSRNGAGWIGEPLGMALAFGAGIGWGSYILLMKKVGAMFAGLEGLSVSLIFAAAVAVPFGFAQSGMHVAPQELVLTAGLALLVPLLPYALEMTTLRRLPASSFGLLMSVEPAIGALAGFIVLGQPLGVLQLGGMFLVVSASIGNVLTS
ncbi:DMT family transporter [Paraburkholderia sp. BR10882]|uniref:EamA family transporter n=1 Tax=unclassified Paraburkholderia TaxID=2615204 RepID=UPI0034CFC08D